MSASSAPADPIHLEVLGVTGTDQRQIVERDGPPWNAIGRLNRTTGGFCTATVIGPRRVLTAAHCLWNRRTAAWFPNCALHFLAGYRRDAYLMHVLVADTSIAPGYDPRQPDPARDWAVLTLAQAIAPGIGIATLAPGVPARSTTLAQAGYSRDHHHVLTLDPACHQRGRGRDLFLHDCDATFGDSGSPLFAEQAGEWRLVGMHVAVRGHGEQARGIANTLPGLNAWLQAHPAPVADLPMKACALPHTRGGADS